MASHVQCNPLNCNESSLLDLVLFSDQHNVLETTCDNQGADAEQVFVESTFRNSKTTKRGRTHSERISFWLVHTLFEGLHSGLFALYDFAIAFCFVVHPVRRSLHLHYFLMPIRCIALDLVVFPTTFGACVRSCCAWKADWLYLLLHVAVCATSMYGVLYASNSAFRCCVESCNCHSVFLVVRDP